jgi:nitrogen fixation/metabolism regulation signal transduction histidine kinase
MNSISTPLKRLKSGFVPAALLIVLMVGSLFLMSSAMQNSEQFGRLYSTLLVINLAILLLLLILIGLNLQRVIRQYRSQATGSRLAARLVLIFVILSLAPVTVVYYFSLQFLTKGIDSWFDVRIEQALQDALELGRSALDMRMRELMKQTELTAKKLGDLPDSMATLSLNDLRSESDASELTLLNQSGRIIASNTVDTTTIIPNRPNEAILLQLRTGRTYVGLDPIGDNGLYIRVVVQVPDMDPMREPRLLQALYPVPERTSVLADGVQSAYAKYQELSYLRQPLKYSFTLTLSLVLLMSILAAVWAAFVSAQRLVAPIRVLAIGTRAVAAGNYGKRLPMSSKDELGSLVESFNDMTEKIALARDEVRQSQQQTENERAYLKAVLGSLSSGVLTIDQFHVLRTANAASNKILGADLVKVLGTPIDQISNKYSHLQGFVNALKPRLAKTNEEWREELTLFGAGGRQVLMCRGRSLPGTARMGAGYVVVFDDITALIQAERDAAWGEVARRLAHEIKNPLTPIQLSAERLRHKYLKTMGAGDADVLDRLTHTIIQQVEALKEMVKAFSEYARMPRMELTPLNLNDLIVEVLDLYQGTETMPKIHLQLDRKIPIIDADPMRIRQLLHNVIKNAFEATKNDQQSDITLRTQLVQDSMHSFVELGIQDTGPGIPDDILSHLFEPYVTTKPKGTGLGLAIVKKIVEEHGGMVWAENSEKGGANIVIRLPVPDAMDSGQPVQQIVH